jgi:predicted nuclease of predicted toxin-antitoxin system
MSPASNWSFLADENMPKLLVSALRAAGHAAEDVYMAGLRGQLDADIYAYAQAHRQTIITGDLDFANVTRYPPPHFGIIVVRLPNMVPPAERVQEVLNALMILEGQRLANTLFIGERGRTRRRSSK